ncbi:uncharacterized protein LOC126818591 [Patella vulgata]|uniref:uncharacterized protein LOC126818591 n=1 Tax=Patella vulgata TaxID=6465 RepID=UPI00217FCEB8|nr:uncharacterized protein LOC126818591 [Patella vulgata]
MDNSIPADVGEVTVGLSPLITFIILVTGVIGGIIIVLCVIIFCKYCIKTKRYPPRYSAFERDQPFDRRFPPLQRYETINSDVFSDHSSASLDGPPVSPRRYTEQRNNFSCEKGQDKVSLVDEIPESLKHCSEYEKGPLKDRTSEQEGGSPVSFSEEGQSHNGARRVSFQLQNLPPQTQSNPNHPLRKFRRYTEGDFHHLKRSKIAKVSIPRQYSLGTPALNGSFNGIESCINKGLPERHRHSLSVIARDPPTPTHVTQGSPLLINKPIKTQVSVEIHQYSPKLGEYRGDLYEIRREFRPMPPHNLRRTIVGQKPPYSHSLETVSPTQNKLYRETRKVKSYEDVADYDVLKITEFSKGSVYSADYDVISERDSPFFCKVRYNDTGSLEKLNEEHIEYLGDLDLEGVMPDESDDTETLNGTQKYRELWSLRTTLEEEEECSDTIRMENMTSPEESPDRDHATPYTTSFESNTEPPSDTGVSDQLDSGIQWERSNKGVNNLLHPPNQENRRQNYRNILTRRLQKAGPNQTSGENSFDSVETDGEISDTSRYEVTTTSFESTTDNTDSTTESQHRLQQMKADSGYKSLETQQSTKDSVDGEKKTSPPNGSMNRSSPPRDAVDESAQKSVGKRNGNPNHFDRRNVRTASKKRREYSRQAVRVYESINEPETDSRSDLPSGDSFEDNTAPSKMFVFSRFFKSHSRGSRDRYLTRDYSIDEKTNRIFNDFIRTEPPREPCTRLGVRKSPRLHNRHRLHRKHTDPLFGQDRRRDRLAPETRSTSLGSDSSASSVRRLSPQDSIEEEEFEGEEEERRVTWGDESARPRAVVSQPAAIHPIPIIKLPEEESGDS